MHRGRRWTLIGLLLLGVGGVAAYGIFRTWLDAGAGRRRAAEQALQRHDLRAASAHLAQALTDQPNDIAARLLAARTARRLGEFDEAERHLEIYRRKHGAVDALELEYRLLHLQKGDLTEADKWLAACADRPRDAETPLVLEAIIEGNLAVLNHAFALGVVFEGGDEAAKARRAAGLWLEQRRGVIDQVQGLIWSSRLHFVAGDHVRAVAELRRAVELDPEHFEARRQLADTIAQEAPLETVAYYEMLRQRQPDNADLLYSLAAIRRNLGELEEARRLLDGLLAAQPDHAAGLLERGKVALDQGQLPEAEALLRRARDRQPNDAETNLALSRCLHRAGKAAEAKEYRDRFQELEAEKRRRRDEFMRKFK